LPAIKELGYRAAVVKSVNGGRLIPVGTFETGIKKPLIPIALINEPPVSPTPVPQSTGMYTGARGRTVINPTAAPYGNNGGVVNPAPRTYGSAGGAVPPEATTTAANLPNIRGRFKRGSAQKLELVLKEKGYYDGLIAGYYGNGTKSAYEAAWADMSELKKYQMLGQDLYVSAADQVASWPEVKVLRAVAEDMSGGLTDQDLANASVGNRRSLYAATVGLSKAAVTRANAWELTLWENLDEWAIEDPLHAQLVSAFRVSYFQSQVRLEDYYMDKGHASDVAKDLAVATLQELVGANLERFLY
jgi:hypothetical protein